MTKENYAKLLLRVKKLERRENKLPEAMATLKREYRYLSPSCDHRPVTKKITELEAQHEKDLMEINEIYGRV